jgi:hypothetical protein
VACSDAQPEESGNNDYDDHDADDVKNVHCTLQLRHARLQGESTMLQQETFETILSSGTHEIVAPRTAASTERITLRLFFHCGSQNPPPGSYKHDLYFEERAIVTTKFRAWKSMLVSSPPLIGSFGD